MRITDDLRAAGVHIPDGFSAALQVAAERAVRAKLAERPRIFAEKVPSIYDSVEGPPPGFAQASISEETRDRKGGTRYQTQTVRTPATITAIWEFRRIPDEVDLGKLTAMVHREFVSDEYEEWGVPVEFETWTSNADGEEVEGEVYPYQPYFHLEAIGGLLVKQEGSHTLIGYKFRVIPELLDQHTGRPIHTIQSRAEKEKKAIKELLPSPPTPPGKLAPPGKSTRTKTSCDVCGKTTQDPGVCQACRVPKFLKGTGVIRDASDITATDYWVYLGTGASEGTWAIPDQQAGFLIMPDRKQVTNLASEGDRWEVSNWKVEKRRFSRPGEEKIVIVDLGKGLLPYVAKAEGEVTNTTSKYLKSHYFMVQADGKKWMVAPIAEKQAHSLYPVTLRDDDAEDGAGWAVVGKGIASRQSIAASNKKTLSDGAKTAIDTLVYVYLYNNWKHGGDVPLIALEFYGNSNVGDTLPFGFATYGDTEVEFTPTEADKDILNAAITFNDKAKQLILASVQRLIRIGAVKEGDKDNKGRMIFLATDSDSDRLGKFATLARDFVVRTGDNAPGLPDNEGIQESIRSFDGNDLSLERLFDAYWDAGSEINEVNPLYLIRYINLLKMEKEKRDAYMKTQEYIDMSKKL